MRIIKTRLLYYFSFFFILLTFILLAGCNFNPDDNDENYGLDGATEIETVVPEVPEISSVRKFPLPPDDLQGIIDERGKK